MKATHRQHNKRDPFIFLGIGVSINIRMDDKYQVVQNLALLQPQHLPKLRPMQTDATKLATPVLLV